MQAITSKYPVQVICGIVGVPLEDSAQFHRWAELINTGPLDPPNGLAASQAMRDATLADFRQSQAWGIRGFPAVVAEHDGALHLVAQGYLPVEALRERLTALAMQGMTTH